MKIGVSLPVREMENDISAIRAFAQLAEELGFTHLRVPESSFAARQWTAARTTDINGVHRWDHKHY